MRWRSLSALIAGAALGGCGETSGSRMAPILYSGSLSNTVRTTGSSDQEREYGNIVAASVRANSYVWEPYIVTVDGTVTVGHDFEAGGGDGVSNSVVASGTGTINILPLSPIPTSISYTHTESVLDSDRPGVEFSGDQLTISSRARIDEDLNISSFVSADQVDQGEDGTDRGLETSLSVVKNFEESTLTGNARYRVREFTAGEPGEEDSEDTLAFATVTYESSPFEDTRMQNFATALFSDETEGDDRDLRYSLQTVTSVQWRPDDRAFSVNGSLRGLWEQVESSGTDPDDDGQSTATVATATVGLNYPINPHLVANVGFNAAYENIDESGAGGNSGLGDEGERERVSFIGSLAYESESYDVGEFDWRFSADGTAELGYETDDGPTESVGIGAGHTLTRGFDAGMPGPLQLSFSQSAGATQTLDDTPTVNIAHTLALSSSWVDEGTSTFVRLSATDDRDLIGEDRSEFQLAQFLLSRQASIDLDSYWRANLSLQISRQTFEDEGTDTSFSANGELGYNARNIFGVENFDFLSELILTSQGPPRVFGDDEDDDDSDFLRADWRNRLEYRIGRLLFRLEGTVFWEDGEIGDLVLFRVKREFSGRIGPDY